MRINSYQEIGSSYYNNVISSDVDEMVVRKISSSNKVSGIDDSHTSRVDNTEHIDRLNSTDSTNRVTADSVIEADTSVSQGVDSEKKLLSGKDAMEFAVNKYMTKDKALIGSTSSLESLDVQKAISNLQKDSILREYQSFVNNVEQEDGSVRRIS